MERTACSLLIALALSLLTSCKLPKVEYDESGGHRARVVEAITGRGLKGAKIFGGEPSFQTRKIKAKADGEFYFHFRVVPQTMKIEYRGYKTIHISTRDFLNTEVFRMYRDDSPKSPIWKDGKDDPLTPFERELIRQRSGVPKK
ncbi:MAG: hypothetical protein QGF00_02960 [Planctomycetota bacterium]|jgi:hypothetical protein|nr:hypothetical protein [Planctomycetota bacterium]MDP7248537.1 hypothetical protein [Planctomycetota bacterium]